MRVGFVIQDLYFGGAQYVTALVIRGFVARGYDVDLLLSQVHCRYGEVADGHPFDVPLSVRQMIMPYAQARKNVHFIRRYLSHTDSAAVFAMSSNYTMALSIASRGLFRHPRLYHVEHGIAGVASWHSSRNLTRRLYHRLKDWFVYRVFDGVLTVCDGGRRDFVRSIWYPQRKVVNVYNPVIDSLYWEKLKAEPAHRWLQHKRCPTFVAAGMHTELKGHMFLLELFRRLAQKQQIRLIIFGRGELTEKYKAFIAENHMEDVVSLPGFTNNLPAEIQASDGLLVASTTESFSLVLVEALATGRPVIATDCDYGPREVLEGGRWGQLVPCGDMDAYEQAVLNVVNGKTPQTGPEAWRRFTVETIVTAYEKVVLGRGS